MFKEKTQVIALSVGTISGGVFTAEPESYYADDEGNVQKYTFGEWKSEMIKSGKGNKSILLTIRGQI